MSGATITRGLVRCSARRQQTLSISKITSPEQRFVTKSQRRTATTSRSAGSSTSTSIGIRCEDPRVLLSLGVATTATCFVVAAVLGATTAADGCDGRTTTTLCSALKGTDVLMLEPHKESSTGILFPHLCNAMTFVGCGVRYKYGFVKVYAVGTYVDPMAMSAVKTQGPEAIQKALINPSYPRTIRIVMNRSLSIEKYTAAIIEALEPRMGGEDMDKLEEFKKLNPPVDLIEGAEMEMTVRGNTMLYKNSVGGVGQIDSEVFCRAMCDTFYGKDAVSPGHRDDVLEGVQKL